MTSIRSFLHSAREAFSRLYCGRSKDIPLVLYGQTQEADEAGSPSLELSYVAMRTTPEGLREIAAFLVSAADEIEAHDPDPETGWHSHWRLSGPGPDVIVYPPL